MSDIDTAMVVDSLKVLDPKPPIREADIAASLLFRHAGTRLGSPYPLPQIEIFSDAIDRRQFGRQTQRSVR